MYDSNFGDNVIVWGSLVGFFLCVTVRYGIRKVLGFPFIIIGGLIVWLGAKITGEVNE